MNDDVLMLSHSPKNLLWHSHNESDADRLRGTTAPDALRVDLVSAFSGDREMTEAESNFMQMQKNSRGKVFYSDLFYAISHHYFSPEIARRLWQKVIDHKHLLSEKLGRNIRITVATLDYLSNITDEIRSLTLMSETYVSEIANLSMVDGMTGLFNHSSCYAFLELELRNYIRYGVGVALILLDIDNFKLVNDQCGHQEGDRILIEFANTLKKQTRNSDICCRFGGEEFVVILPFTSVSNEALVIAERIREGAMSIVYSGQHITISAGVALCDSKTRTPQALVEKADHALYQAKNKKNKVILYVDQQE